MTLLSKEKALYVKTAVIQCGVPDYHKDILNAEDIKRIFTSFNNQDSFDIHHKRLPVHEVGLLENYISKTEEDIAGTIVPKGSWNIVLRVDNPEIKDKIFSGEIQGVSLTNGVKSVCKKGLTKKNSLQYKDLPNAECWIPHFISLVSEPANMVGLHVMDYDVYVEKSKRDESKLFGGHNLSFMDKLKKLIAEEEATIVEPTVEKSVEDETKVESEAEEEPVVDKSANSEEEEKEEEPVVDKSANSEEEEKEEEVVEKATESESDDATGDYDARITALEEKIAELESKIEDKKTEEDDDETGEPVEEVKVEEEPVITKSKKITVIDTKTENNKNFYELSGRDPLTGKKIRQEPRIIQ